MAGQEEESPEGRLFIGGAFAEAAQGGWLPVVDPATGRPTPGRRLARGGGSDVRRAVAAAKTAWAGGAWRALGPASRAAVLRRVAAEVEARKAELAALETLDCGKPVAEAEWDMDDVAGCFRYYADLAEAAEAEEAVDLGEGGEGFAGAVAREPLGVVGLITPWNYPLLMAAWKVAPALAAGCCAVLKPSEHASLTCLELAAIARRAGVPAGVLNVVTGLGTEAGAALAAHPGLAKVSFTGSLATGRLVARAAAEHVVPCTLELGGKSPCLVFDDVDVAKAVEWAMFGCFWTNGQICSATSRLLVHERVAEAFLARLKSRAQQIRVLPPADPASRLGPLVCEQQYQKVVDHIRRAPGEGATLLCGGGRPRGLEDSGGFWVEPTVFVDVPEDSALWREEVFGPVLAVRTFATEAEAVALANASAYALGAAVLTADERRARAVAAQLEAGIVWINCSQPCFPQLPWGGAKRSGYGRELSPQGLANFQHVKAVVRYTAPDTWDWYSPPPAAKL